MSPRPSRALAFATLLAAALGTALLAADPPPLIHYQGVLRDASDRPLDGSYDMVFRFWNDPVWGDELLVDSHTEVSGGAVIVSNGLFGVALGGGSVTDGSGPQTYTSLVEVFRDFGTVYLELQIGAELLAPRVRVVSTGYALNAARLAGRAADEFLDTTGTPQVKGGPLRVDNVADTDPAISGYGVGSGGYFKDIDGSGSATLGTGHIGIRAEGRNWGGYFSDSDEYGEAYLGYFTRGIEAYGTNAGGHFMDVDSTGSVFCAYGDRGIEASGAEAGGHFTGSGSGEAYLGYVEAGVYGRSAVVAGEFRNTSGYATALLGYRDPVNSYYGILAEGANAGGQFKSLVGGAEAYVAKGVVGIEATGSDSGGYFTETTSGATARVSWGGYGISASGVGAGGLFQNTSTSGYAYVAYGTNKILGSGSVSFVQNHPYEPDHVIVYNAPEGDEVATYTRGSARLMAGEARVPLSESFGWVTNPDLGLTAHVTPRGGWSDLYVASVTPRELVVRTRDGAGDGAFDYIVHGLRVGFEQVGIVQEKRHESPIPAMDAHLALYARRPDLRRFNALERFRAMADRPGEIDLSASEALARAVGRHVADGGALGVPPAALGPGPVARAEETGVVGGRGSAPAAGSAQAGTAATAAVALEWPAAPPDYTPIRASEPIEVGDVLVLDRERPGHVRRASFASDRALAGVAAGVPRDEAGELVVPVALVGLVRCKVDAGYGAIAVGDPLTASPTPGHAMRAPDGLPSAAILGKAAEPLDAGIGLTLVLVSVH